MNDVSTIVADEDTSFALMKAAFSLEHRVFHAQFRNLFMENENVFCQVQQATPGTDGAPLRLDVHEHMPAETFDAIFIRTDPPFDETYLRATLMLDFVKNTLIINRPQALRDANEKLFTHHFSSFMPNTIVDANSERISNFVKNHGGKAVAKPVDGHGGAQVFLLSNDDSNFNAIVETLTENGRTQTVVQAFVPEVSSTGDKRILLLAGEPLGAIARVPSGNDLRSNIHVGGKAKQATLNADDLAIVDKIRPILLDKGLYFVGIDVIGNRLTEINVTSPTGIQQMSRFDNINYAQRVIEWTERSAEQV